MLVEKEKQAKEVKGHDLARLKARVSRLKGGVATIKVGASSSIEMREKKERLDDALNATKAALEEGIVVGGGLTYVKFTNPSRNPSLPKWFSDALYAPARTLLENSGSSLSVEDWKIEANEGYNALTNKVENLYNAGVFDPVKVTKNSFLAAMSIASLFYSTDVAVLVEE